MNVIAEHVRHFLARVGQRECSNIFQQPRVVAFVVTNWATTCRTPGPLYAEQSTHAAAVLLYQAAEEVGKAKLLKNHLDVDQPIAESMLRDHSRKFRLAVAAIALSWP